jgi:hypothetical protein
LLARLRDRESVVVHKGNDQKDINSSTMPAEKPEKWKDSEAKALLRSDIISKRAPATMTAKEVYGMRPEYMKFPYKNFPTNLNNLRKAIADNYERMQVDCEAYGHDLSVLKKSVTVDLTNLPWHKSEAKELLRKDIDDGKHLQMEPSALRSTREEYMGFTSEVFRKHIHQEVDSRSKRAFRFEKKSKKTSQAVLRIEKKTIASIHNQS